MRWQYSIACVASVAGCGRVAFDLVGGTDPAATDGAVGDGTGLGGDGGNIDVPAGTMFRLAPTADTYIMQNTMQDNDATPQLFLGTTMSGMPSASLLLFDTSSIPSNLTITNATLVVLRVSSMGTDTITTTVHQITSAWSSPTVTWATRPSWNTSAVASASVTLNVTPSATYDVTSLVAGWHTAPVNNLGLAIEAAAAPAGALFIIGSIEASAGADRPVLTVFAQ